MAVLRAKVCFERTRTLSAKHDLPHMWLKYLCPKATVSNHIHKIEAHFLPVHKVGALSFSGDLS